MTDKAISPLRRRLIEDMTIRRLSPKTQLHYIRRLAAVALTLSVAFKGRSSLKFESVFLQQRVRCELDFRDPCPAW
jgi:hypothetical protein